MNSMQNRGMMQMHHHGAGGSQGAMPSGQHQAAEFGSAVSSGLNSHLNQLSQQQQQIGNNQQNYIHNLTSNQLLLIGNNASQNERQGQSSQNQSQGRNPGGSSGGLNQGVSIIDQLSAAANQSSAQPQHTTASLFDDFAGFSAGPFGQEQPTNTNQASSLFAGDEADSSMPDGVNKI